MSLVSVGPSEGNRAMKRLCSWCDAIATRKLHSVYDPCCEAHYAQWFAAEEREN